MGQNNRRPCPVQLLHRTIKLYFKVKHFNEFAAALDETPSLSDGSPDTDDG